MEHHQLELLLVDQLMVRHQWDQLMVPHQWDQLMVHHQWDQIMVHHPWHHIMVDHPWHHIMVDILLILIISIHMDNHHKVLVMLLHQIITLISLLHQIMLLHQITTLITLLLHIVLILPTLLHNQQRL